MSNIIACSFEGGISPSNLTLTGSTLVPYSGHKEYWNWCAVGSYETSSQINAYVPLGDILGELWVSFRTRSETYDFNSPMPILEVGVVTITVTSSTTVNVTINGNSTDITVFDIDGAWNDITCYINLVDAIENAVVIYFNGDSLFSYDATSGAIGTEITNINIKGTKGIGSSLDDLLVKNDGGIGIPPPMIEGHKALPAYTLFSSWESNGSPENVFTGNTILDLTFNNSNQMMYGIDATGQIKYWNSFNSTFTSVGSPLTNAGCGAMCYHRALNRIYFIENNVMKYLDKDHNIINTEVTSYYTGKTTYVSGSEYNSKDRKAYIITLTSTTANIHIIDINGNITVTNNTMTSISPTFNLPLSVVYDSENNKIVFPLYDRHTMGMILEDDILYESNADSTARVISIVHSGMYSDTGKYLAITYKGTTTSPTTNVLRLFDSNTNSFTDYSTISYTTTNGTGLATSNMCYHPYLATVFYRYYNTTNLYQIHPSTGTATSRQALALVYTSDYFTGKINPLTNGMFFISSGSISEARTMSKGRKEANIMIRDTAFLEEGTPNDSLCLASSQVVKNKTLFHSNYAVFNAFGNGKISFNDSIIKTLTSVPKNIVISAEPLPQANILYDFSTLPSSLPYSYNNLGTDEVTCVHAGTTNSMVSVIETNTSRKFLYLYTYNTTAYGYIKLISLSNTEIVNEFTYAVTLSVLVNNILITAKSYITNDIYLLFDASANGKLYYTGGTIDMGYLGGRIHNIVVGRHDGIVEVFVDGKLKGSFESTGSLATTYGIRMNSPSYVYGMALWNNVWLNEKAIQPCIYSKTHIISKL